MVKYMKLGNSYSKYTSKLLLISRNLIYRGPIIFVNLNCDNIHQEDICKSGNKEYPFLKLH